MLHTLSGDQRRKSLKDSIEQSVFDGFDLLLMLFGPFKLMFRNDQIWCSCLLKQVDKRHSHYPSGLYSSLGYVFSSYTTNISLMSSICVLFVRLHLVYFECITVAQICNHIQSTSTLQVTHTRCKNKMYFDEEWKLNIKQLQEAMWGPSSPAGQSCHGNLMPSRAWL